MEKRDYLFGRVKRAVAETLNVPAENVKEESRYVEDLGATSLDLVMLGMLLEEELKIEISHDDFRPLKTVGSTLDFLLSNFSIEQGDSL